MLPPALHLLQGTFVRFIATGDDFVQVLVLRLDDRISGISAEREIAWSAQLFTRHCLHESRLFHSVRPSTKTVWTGREKHLAVPSDQCTASKRSGLRDAHEVARGVAERTVAHSPGLRRRLLEHLGPRRPDLLEGGVEVVGAEDGSLQ